MPPGITVEDSPLEMLLKEQGTLQTPVGVFSSKHDQMAQEPEQAQFYKQLLPLSRPKAGEQYAFKVDLDKCTGCKACVSACHSLNGLDENETWRDVGTIHGFDDNGSYTQTVTTACHHCADPGCLNGCPVLAYEKDKETGIVRHLDDQCIGCQYCALKCPYDVPKYSKSLGIVRKCDMCYNRLAEGEAPACVQACPTEAISITIVNTHRGMTDAGQNRNFLDCAPDPSYTEPTTQYVTQRSIPQNVEAADQHHLKPEHTHLPLVGMLTLTQLSVGSYIASILCGDPTQRTGLAVIGFVTMALGLIASTTHLGRPFGAWRAFLGLRRSWLSREIVVFGACFPLAAAYTISLFLKPIPLWILELAGWLTCVSGLVGVFCSAMIYHDTRRDFWRLPVSGGKFFGTTMGLGLAANLILQVITTKTTALSLSLIVITVFVVKLSLEASQLRALRSVQFTPAKKSALLMFRVMKPLLFARFIIGIIGIATVFFALFMPNIIMLSFMSLLAGELMERALFFRAVTAPKMPGGVQS